MLEPAVRRLANMEDDVPSPIAAKQRVDSVLRADPRAPLCAREIMLSRVRQVNHGRGMTCAPLSAAPGVSTLDWMVEPGGIEPPTSCMPCKRSPS